MIDDNETSTGDITTKIKLGLQKIFGCVFNILEVMLAKKPQWGLEVTLNHLPYSKISIFSSPFRFWDSCLK